MSVSTSRGVSGNNSLARERAAGVPTPVGDPIGTGVFFQLPGLTQFDQAVAFTGQANGSTCAALWALRTVGRPLVNAMVR
jgi:hypothetical protein